MLMSWYPGKVVERIRGRIRFEELPSRETYEKLVERFPELRDIYDVADRIMAKYPPLRSKIIEWKNDLSWMSYHARSCDILNLVRSAERANQHFMEIIKSGIVDFDDATLLLHRETEFQYRVAEIYRKLSGAKPPEYPPVEGYIEV